MAGTGPHGPVVGGVGEPLSAPEKEYRFSEQAVRELDEIVSHYPEKRAAMLPALWIAQREYGGYLPPEALQEVADRLERPYVEVEAVATFYTMYNFRPRGKHHLEVCTCLTCGVVGAYGVVHKLQDLLNIGLGETTPDGEFTLSEVECLDWCGAGTVIQVGDKYFGNVRAENVELLLDQLRSSPDHTPTGLADAITKVLLPGGGSGGAATANAGPPADEQRVKEVPPVTGDTPSH